jgi:glutathione S-transferase
VANDLLPGWPRWPQRKAVARVARHMIGYLPKAGVVPAQRAGLEASIERQLGALDRHFAEHPFLFGSRPLLGDFGLVGPLYGHLSRDPWPAQHLIAPRRPLRRIRHCARSTNCVCCALRPVIGAATFRPDG